MLFLSWPWRIVLVPLMTGGLILFVGIVPGERTLGWALVLSAFVLMAIRPLIERVGKSLARRIARTAW